MGALFAGIVLSYLVDDFKTKELPFFLFPMLSIFMIKEAGMFFSFAAAGLFIFLTLWKNYQKKEGMIKLSKFRVGMITGMLCSLFVFSQYWNYSLEKNNIQSGKQSLAGIVKDIITGERDLPEKELEKVRNNFWKVFYSQQVHKEKISLNYNESSYNILPKYTKNIKLTALGFMLFITLLLVAVYQLTTDLVKRQQVKIIGGYLLAIYGIYLSILYMSYLIAFGGMAVRIPSYVRYVNIATLPIALIVFSLFLPFFQRKESTKSETEQQKLIRAHALALLALVLITRPYLKPLYSQNTPPSRKNLQYIAKKITEQLPQQSNLLVVMPQISGSMFDPMLRYYLMPARPFISSRDFLKKSPEEMQEIYAKYDHIWFPQLSKGIIRKNRQVLQQTLDGKIFGLYKVEKTTNSYKAIL